MPRAQGQTERWNSLGIGRTFRSFQSDWCKVLGKEWALVSDSKRSLTGEMGVVMEVKHDAWYIRSKCLIDASYLPPFVAENGN